MSVTAGSPGGFATKTITCNVGRHPALERFQLRHGEQREAIHRAASAVLDCFVAEPVIGPRFARTRWLLAMTTALHRVRRDEAADDDAAAVVHVPDHGFSDRVTRVADDGALGHQHPLAFDRYPVGAIAHVVFGAGVGRGL